MLQLLDITVRHRCGTLCLYARGSQCDCSCEGRNHGKLRAFSVEREERLGEEAQQAELFERETQHAG